MSITRSETFTWLSYGMSMSVFIWNYLKTILSIIVDISISLYVTVEQSMETLQGQSISCRLMAGRYNSSTRPENSRSQFQQKYSESIILEDNLYIDIQIVHKFVSKDPIANTSAVVYGMVWCHLRHRVALLHQVTGLQHCRLPISLQYITQENNQMLKIW